MTPEDRIKKLGSMGDATPTEAEWTAFSAQARRSVVRRRMAAALGTASLLLVAVGAAFAITNSPGEPERGPEISNSLTFGPATEEPPPTSTPAQPDEVGSVALQQWFIHSEKLDVFYARFEKSETPARDALENLLAGVPDELGETGIRSEIPEGTTLVDLTIENGTASVTLGGDFPDDSDEQQGFAFAQIIYTLTQFPTVDDVTLSWESAESGGVAMGGTEDRKTYEDLLAPIVVEHPYAGGTPDRTFMLSGIANVFEANVSWQLVDEQSKVLQEGFTTATCGTGCWGTFEDEITYKGDLDYVRLLVFQSSPEDGSPMHLVEVPLNFKK